VAAAVVVMSNRQPGTRSQKLHRKLSVETERSASLVPDREVLILGIDVIWKRLDKERFNRSHQYVATMQNDWSAENVLLIELLWENIE
jgi:hypothetical protein